jgi:hypothetical protein
MAEIFNRQVKHHQDEAISNELKTTGLPYIMDAC